MEMSELLQIVIDENASDLHISVGKPPVLRIDGRLEQLDLDPLGPPDTERFVKSLTPEDYMQRVIEKGGADFGFGFGGLARFRVSVFRQKGYFGLVARLIPSHILSFEDIGLPLTIKDLLFKPRGLILVTGPTGSGKTTTLATMLNTINEERDCHLLTIEDPIEYYHEHKRCVINQREVGVDVPNFSEALIKGLRQDPDVILIGEMRDLQTMEAALTAAETGHLVFATLHTTGAAKTVDRIIDAFPTNHQEQIRMQVSGSLLAVVSQTLIPRLNRKGRIAAFEIMVSTPSIQNLIRENKTFRITSDIQTGARHGMVTLDAFLYSLYMRKEISYNEMIVRAQDPESLISKIKAT